MAVPGIQGAGRLGINPEDDRGWEDLQGVVEGEVAMPGVR